MLWTNSLSLVDSENKSILTMWKNSVTLHWWLFLTSCEQNKLPGAVILLWPRGLGGPQVCLHVHVRMVVEPVLYFRCVCLADC